MCNRKTIVLFVCVAVLLGGCSLFTSPPSVPGGLTVEGATSTSLQISWSSVDKANSYQLYRDTSSAGSFTSMVYDGSGTSYADTGLSASTTYYYKVQATNDAGSSALSSAKSGTTTSGGGSGTASLTVINNWSFDIWYLYISPVSSPNWGNDQLGASTIAIGGSFTLNNIPADVYDLKVESSGHTYYKTLSSQTMLGGHVYTWTVVP